MPACGDQDDSVAGHLGCFGASPCFDENKRQAQPLNKEFSCQNAEMH